jgi:hypothetical protein
MAYILAAQRDQDGPEAERLWREYERYIQANRASFPPGAFALATSDWNYGFSDHRAPHDAWLEWAKFDEPATGERNETRYLSLRVRLLGAYHDNYLELFYPRVYAYTLTHNIASSGHGDWRYDEFRLSPKGHLIHEIEWASYPDSDARWLIEASDVEYSVIARTEV